MTTESALMRGVVKAVGDALEAGQPLTPAQVSLLQEKLDPFRSTDSFLVHRVKGGVIYVVMRPDYAHLYTGPHVPARLHLEKIKAFFSAGA